MPRKTRVEIAGGLYHVLTRGNDRKTIFHFDFRFRQDACRKVISEDPTDRIVEAYKQMKVQAAQYRRLWPDPFLVAGSNLILNFPELLKKRAGC